MNQIEERSKPTPQDLGGGELERRRHLFENTGVFLYTHAPVKENEAEQVMEDIHHRNFFHFSGITLKK